MKVLNEGVRKPGDYFHYFSERHLVRHMRLSPEPVDYGFRVTDLVTGEQQDFREPIDRVAVALGYDGVSKFLNKEDVADSFS